MLQFQNQTPFAGTILLLPNPEGIESVYAVVKATYKLTQPVAIAEKQTPLALKDEYHGEPGQSSLKVAGDVSLIRPGTDVLLSGVCHAKGQVTQAEVTLKVGPINKTVAVFGDRVWESGFLGSKMSSPAPFETMPLVWERAFGGSDQTEQTPPELHAESRNPVGTGFVVKNGTKKLDGMKLPNLEDPKQPIKSAKDRPAPAGVGPIAPHWEPRRSFAGTYDEAWQKQRSPYLPTDFDARFFQAAPADQIVPGYLKGGEDVEVGGVSPSGPLKFRLPTQQPQATFRLDQEDHSRPMNLETVLIEAEDLRLVMVWRTVFVCDKKSLRVREVAVSLAETN